MPWRKNDARRILTNRQYIPIIQLYSLKIKVFDNQILRDSMNACAREAHGSGAEYELE